MKVDFCIEQQQRHSVYEFTICDANQDSMYYSVWASIFFFYACISIALAIPIVSAIQIIIKNKQFSKKCKKRFWMLLEFYEYLFLEIYNNNSNLFSLGLESLYYIAYQMRLCIILTSTKCSNLFSELYV